jgi:hypothetical protein
LLFRFFFLFFLCWFTYSIYLFFILHVIVCSWGSLVFSISLSNDFFVLFTWGMIWLGHYSPPFSFQNTNSSRLFFVPWFTRQWVVSYIRAGIWASFFLCLFFMIVLFFVWRLPPPFLQPSHWIETGIVFRVIQLHSGTCSRGHGIYNSRSRGTIFFW